MLIKLNNLLFKISGTNYEWIIIMGSHDRIRI